MAMYPGNFHAQGGAANEPSLVLLIHSFAGRRRTAKNRLADHNSDTENRADSNRCARRLEIAASPCRSNESVNSNRYLTALYFSRISSLPSSCSGFPAHEGFYSQTRDRIRSSVANPDFSNRQYDLLEALLSHRKQRIGLRPNSQNRGKRDAQLSLADLPQFPLAIPPSGYIIQTASLLP
jgi:hypothetical protein